MYLTLVWLTGLVAFGSAIIGYQRSRDTFYPLMFLGPMLAYPYFISPLQLHQKGVLAQYLPVDALSFIQLVYLLGVLAIALGVLSAARPAEARIRASWHLTPRVRAKLRQAGLLLGVAGVGAYLYMVFNVGGLQSAYGDAHGGGWAAIGYIREAKFLVLPGLLFFMLAKLGRRLRPGDWAWLAFMTLPLLFHGIVGGWRGQAFAVLATVGLGWYMMRFRRPALLTFVAAAMGLAILALVLATHRQELALGGKSFQFQGGDVLAEYTARASRGHEYIYGSGLVYDAAERGAYQWGARYVEKLVIRAIPSAIWPSQYQDLRRFLGYRAYGYEFPALGWRPTRGASVGLLPDMWKQFWWLGLAVLFMVGRAYGAAWHRATAKGGLWVIVYVLMIAFSLYLTQQTLQALLWRVMLLAGASWVVWRLLVRRPWVQAVAHRARAQRRRTVHGPAVGPSHVSR